MRDFDKHIERKRDAKERQKGAKNNIEKKFFVEVQVLSLVTFDNIQFRLGLTAAPAGRSLYLAPERWLHSRVRLNTGLIFGRQVSD